MNRLQEKIEGELVVRSFNVSGMPESVFKDVDSFCKEFYGDSRWTMISDLVRGAKGDFKYAMLYDELQDLKAEIALLKQSEPKVENPTDGVKRYVTFGQKVSIDDLEKNGDLK